MKIIILFIFLTIFICSCSGTGTGNPGLTNADGAIIVDPIDDDKNTVEVIATGVCQRIYKCYGPDAAQEVPLCLNGLFDQDNIDNELGLRPNEYSDLAAIAQAEEDQEITPDRLAGGLCLAWIQITSCEDKRLKEAYIAENLKPYKKANRVFHKSCKKLFK